jgi:hypothetical protein
LRSPRCSIRRSAPAAAGLSLARDSGPVSNASAASHTPDATPGTLKKLGRLGGYALEYGNAFTGAAALTDVRTGIDRYKTAAGAREALAFWKKEDAKLSTLNQPGFSVVNVPVQIPVVGKTKRFRLSHELQRVEHRSISGLDEQIVDPSSSSWANRLDRHRRRHGHRPDRREPDRRGRLGNQLGADDLDEPAPVALAVELDEEDALPRSELKLAFAHGDRFPGRS